METAKLIVAIVAAVAAIIASRITVNLTRSLKKQDILNERRRVFITLLWDKLVAVRGVNAGTATIENVTELFNTLELVAFCWKEQIAERKLIALAFGKSYCERVAEIEAITIANGYSDVIAEMKRDLNIKSGAELLTNSDLINKTCCEIKKYLFDNVAHTN